MYKNTSLYHRLWYVRKRNSKRVHILIKLLFVLIILGTLCSYAYKGINSYVDNMTEAVINPIISEAVNKTLNESFAEGLNYEEFLDISRDKNGRVTSIHTNAVNMNKLTVLVSDRAREMLLEESSNNLKVPFGTLFGSAFSGLGPKIDVRLIPYSVNTNLKSDFADEGSNKTRYSLSIEVNARIGIDACFITKEKKVDVVIPFIETIILNNIDIK